MRNRIERIEYIDAIRGFMMLLVVYGHIETFSFYGFNYDTIIGTFIRAFWMPLFFFVSGFVAILSERKIDILKSIKKKASTLLIPTLIIGSIYVILCCNSDFLYAIKNNAKVGYWFTLVSFEIFVVYYILRKYKVSYLWMFVLALVLYALKLPLKLNSTFCEVGNVLSLHYMFEYFQFFIFGAVAAKYKDVFAKILDQKILIVIISFLLLMYVKCEVIGFDYRSNLFTHIISTFNDLLLGYLGLLLVFAVFKHYEFRFSKTTKLGYSLQYIGRRTLDIYLLHYFFLPTLPMVGNFFKEYPNMVLELTVGIVLSLLIIGVCLIVSNVLRTSDILGYWLFGAKKIDNK